MLVYVLMAVCAIQFIVIAVLYGAVTMSSEIIEDLRAALKRANGEN